MRPSAAMIGLSVRCPTDDFPSSVRTISLPVGCVTNAPWNKIGTTSILARRRAAQPSKFSALRPTRFSNLRAASAANSGVFAFRILRVNNQTLYPVDRFSDTLPSTLYRWSALTPAPIENGIRGRDTSCRRCILAAHDADQNIDCRSRVAARQRTNFGEGFFHGNAFHLSSGEKHTASSAFDFAVQH